MSIYLKIFLCFTIAFFVGLIISPIIIFLCKKLKASQTILHYVDNHINKQGTPTMGGFIFLIPLFVSLFFLDKQNTFTSYFLIAITFCFALLGFLDDFIKVRGHKNEGLSPWQKIFGQLGISTVVALYMYFSNRTSLNFFNINFDIGIFIIPLVILVLLATTNSVNLTDGLDGLAGSVSFVYVLFFSSLLIVLKSVELDNLALVGFTLIGGVLAFLIFNIYPAKIFMGDTGSLALGGFIGGLSVLSGLELILPIMGVMFVLSAVSDIIQVLHFKRTHKRVFLMAPLHHHFEKKGVHENRIVFVYVVVTLILSLLTLGLYLFVV